jgi:hypothetical protein
MNIEATDGVLTNTQVLGISGVTPTFFANGVSVLATAVAVVGRLTAVFTAASTTTFNARFGIGGGGNATGTIRFSCPQVEAGAFATSYIPTVAAQVTRAADSASMIANNFARWYNQTEGTLYSESTCAGLPTLGTASSFAITDGTINNRLRVGNFTTGNVASDVAVGGVAQASFSASGSFNVSAKVSLGYRLNDVAGSFNGGTAQIDTSATIPVVTQAQIGNAITGRELNGTIRRISYYNRRLSNTELQGLTS